MISAEPETLPMDEVPPPNLPEDEEAPNTNESPAPETTDEKTTDESVIPLEPAAPSEGNKICSAPNTNRFLFAIILFH